MFKKIVAMVAAISMVVSLSGCQSSEASASTANEFPQKPIELIVPWSAGGVADLAARIVATVASTKMSQPIAVVNEVGAAGTLAATQYLQEKSDGYKILLLSTPVITMQPHAREVVYTWDDFEPIIGLQQMEQFLLVNSSSTEFNTLEKLKEVAKEKTLSFGTNGPGAPDHIYATALMQYLDVEVSLVVYDDAISVQNALLGGHIDLGVGNMGNFEEHVKSGSLDILGTFAEDAVTLEDIGEVPSMVDQGIQIAGSLTYFLVGREGTPQEVIDTLYEVLSESLEDETFIEFIETRGLTLTNRNPEELDAYIKEEIVTVSSYFE